MQAEPVPRVHSRGRRPYRSSRWKLRHKFTESILEDSRIFHRWRLAKGHDFAAFLSHFKGEGPRLTPSVL